MKLDDWIQTIPEDEREVLCVADGWRAGADAMLKALIDLGFIGDAYADKARMETKDIVGSSYLNKQI